MTRRGLFGALVGAAAAPKPVLDPQVAIRGRRYLSAVWTDTGGRVHNVEIDLTHHARMAWAQLEAGIKTKAQVMRELGVLK